MLLQALDCHRLHILSGVTSTSANNGACDAELEETFVSNLRYAAERLEREGVMVLIEAINIRAKPDYFLPDPAKAERIVRRVAHPNVRLMFDIYHAQIVGGDLTRRIRDWAPVIGHVQIAQVCTKVILMLCIVLLQILNCLTSYEFFYFKEFLCLSGGSLTLKLA